MRWNDQGITDKHTMADHQKIHPVAADAGRARPSQPLLPRGLSADAGRVRPSQPLLSPGLSVSGKGDPAAAPNKKKRSCCCKCVCWTITLLVLILILLGTIGGILYLVFRPKLPNYSVDSLRISELRFNLDMSLYAKFNVRITATNPNKKIGIYYQKGSSLGVWYSETELCRGSLPRFYQGHRNTTVLSVALTGQNQYGRTLMAALQEQQQTGRIPLDLKVDVPVSVELGKMKLRKVRIIGGCLLMVDSLSANNLISIKASSCNFRVKL